MNIAVCEDDPSQREHIRQICDGYFSGIGQAYQYMEYADGAALLGTEHTGIVQVHKSYAVNLEFVAAIHTEIETKTGNQYPVGRTFRKTVIRMYKEFILKRARSRI